MAGRGTACAAALAAVLAGCAPVRLTARPPAAEAIDCGRPASFAAQLTLEALDPAPAAASLSFAPGGGALTVAAASAIHGPCLDHLRAYYTRFELFDGGLLQQQPGDYATPWTGTTPDALVKTLPPSDATPTLDGARMRWAVEYEGIGPRRVYLGVWPAGQGSVLAAFARDPDGVYGAPVRLLTSSAPVRSVTAFPGLDGPSDTLFVLQDSADGARVVTLWWSRVGWSGV
ncbi:MAG: hypothetical protein JWM33_2516 [Caulobacteraceae bacterium]|nr:hypothetical protein [Caulobacteraceae bacterium]